MIIFTGIDPDLHTIPMVMIPYENERDVTPCAPIMITQINIPKKLKGASAILSLAKLISQKSQTCDDLSGLEFASIAVEGQNIRQATTQGARHHDILNLGTAAGCLLTMVGSLSDDLYFPSPQQWKGSVPKQIHQARICASMEWGYEKRSGYVMPLLEPGTDYVYTSMNEKGDLFEGVPRIGDWKHIMDSVGLALYAKDVFCGIKKYRP